MQKDFRLALEYRLTAFTDALDIKGESMRADKNTIIGIIEFYLTHRHILRREFDYKSQMKTDSPVCVSKIYTPIPLNEVGHILSCIENDIKKMSVKRQEYRRMRYQGKCTLDVICGFLDTKKSTLHRFGEEILIDLAFSVLFDDDARKCILNTEKSRYFR